MTKRPPGIWIMFSGAVAAGERGDGTVNRNSLSVSPVMRLYGTRRNGAEQGDPRNAHDQRHQQDRPFKAELIHLLEVG